MSTEYFNCSVSFPFERKDNWQKIMRLIWHSSKGVWHYWCFSEMSSGMPSLTDKHYWCVVGRQKILLLLSEFGSDCTSWMVTRSKTACPERECVTVEGARIDPGRRAFYLSAPVTTANTLQAFILVVKCLNQRPSANKLALLLLCNDHSSIHFCCRFLPFIPTEWVPRRKHRPISWSRLGKSHAAFSILFLAIEHVIFTMQCGAL